MTFCAVENPSVISSQPFRHAVPRYPRIQPTSGPVILKYQSVRKIPLKWTHAVKTHVAQGSLVIVNEPFAFPGLVSKPKTSKLFCPPQNFLLSLIYHPNFLHRPDSKKKKKKKSPFPESIPASGFSFASFCLVHHEVKSPKVNLLGPSPGCTTLTAVIQFKLAPSFCPDHPSGKWRSN